MYSNMQLKLAEADLVYRKRSETNTNETVLRQRRPFNFNFDNVIFIYSVCWHSF